MAKVLILLGPTGVGKTAISLKLAEEFNMEIISADSVQVFKEFDIGSAKITKKEMGDIKHYGVDLLSPNSSFTASDFVCYTDKIMNDIISKNKTPMIVGGTGLYIKALVNGYNFGGTESHQDFREEMERLACEKGLDELIKRLESLAPELAKEIDLKNKVRVIRALEIATFGTLKSKIEKPNHEYLLLALTMPREKLYKRINERCAKMFESGLVKEVESLYQKYGDCQAMRAIGYKEVLSYLKGEISVEEMKTLVAQHTRNYAKRQLTFLKGMENVVYFDVTSEKLENLEEIIKEWLAKK